MKMDFSKFKKVHEDEHTATLKHPRGHEIKIAKSALSKGMAKDLGDIPVQKFADGGMAQPNAYDEGMTNIGNFAKEYGGKALDFLSNAALSGTDTAIDPATHQAIPTQPDSVAAPASPTIDPTQAAQPASNSVATAPTPAAASSALPSDPFGYGAYSKQFKSGLGQEMSGIKGEAEALGQLGQQQAQSQEDAGTELQKINSQFNEDHSKLMQERGALMHDYMNGHIDPDRIYHTMNTGQKIATTLGLIMGGLGSALTGQENPAMKMLNQTVERDIDAQKNDLGKKQSLLSENLRQFGNLRDAYSMTHAQINDTLAFKLNTEAAKMQDPIMKARAQKMAGELTASSAATMQQIAQSQAMMKAMQSSSNPEQTIGIMRMVNPEKAKEMESRFIPGVGMASIPVSEKARSDMQIRNELDQKLGKLEAFANKNSGTTLDRAVVNQGRTMAQDVQDTYRRANGQGVFREGEAKFVNSMINADPTAYFSSFRTMPGYKQIRAGNRESLNQLYRAHGITQQPVNFSPVNPGR